jgi:hypothetical protein
MAARSNATAILMLLPDRLFFMRFPPFPGSICLPARMNTILMPVKLLSNHCSTRCPAFDRPDQKEYRKTKTSTAPFAGERMLVFALEMILL